jgi:predicted GNAT family acetyltransferase
MSAPLTVIHNPEASRFEVSVDGHLALADYRLVQSPGDGNAPITVMQMTHTETPQALQGQGVAAALVRAALDHAAQQGWKVQPSCSYVRVYMDRHPETQSLRVG